MLVRAAGDGFLAGPAAGSAERRIRRSAEAEPGWLPVRAFALPGGPLPGHGFVIDDLDPHRDCFGAPAAAPTLDAAGAGRLGAALTEAWALIEERAPAHGAGCTDGPITFTPLTGLAPGEPAVGRHGYGALGIGADEDAGTLALTLLRGVRRARFRALVDVTDLYAADGSWEHRMPWQEELVPFSRMLADVHERLALAAFDSRYRDGVAQALDTLEGAAELTVGGKRMLALMRKEF